MKQLAITLRLLQQRLHDTGMGNESALVARMARDAETIGHVNIADAMGFETPQAQPDDPPLTRAQQARQDRQAAKDAE